MSIRYLDRIFKPRSITLIGASNKRNKLGNIILRNLIEEGFKGSVYPVNPKHKNIEGLDTYASVCEITEQIDLAIIVTPLATVPEVIKECADKNIRGVIIISAGGKETGGEGEKIEEQILEEAGKGDIRIIGPNCLGVIVPSIKLNASFAGRSALPGNLAFISQSGALCTAILDMSYRENIGFSHFISVGSMSDVDFGDLIDYLGNRKEVSSIILYIESLTNPKKFISAARAVSRVKPIIALKSGKSSAGSAAAASHTGAMAGEDDVYDAVFKRAGILRVNTINELFYCAEALAKQPMPDGPSLCVITNAGGPGVMAADKLEELGYPPVKLSNNTINALGSFLPANWSRGNPVDIIGDATPGRYEKAFKVCIEADEVDGVIIILTPQAMTKPAKVARSIVKACSAADKPVFAVWMGGDDVKNGITVLNRAGIPTFRFPEEAVSTFISMYLYKYNLELLQETPAELHSELDINSKSAAGIINKALSDNNGVILDETESKKLLKHYGIPVNRTRIARSAAESAEIAEKTGFPVVLKVHSPDITHKSDAGGVILELNNKSDVKKAFRQIITNAREYDDKAEVRGVTVQRMIKDGTEIILGSKSDRLFGPVIMFGAGGILAEIIKDRAIGIPPLNSTLTRRMMEATKVFRILRGFRNMAPVNLRKTEEIIIRLSHLVADFPEIKEIDINPLLASENDIIAVDARVVLQRTDVVPPSHLAIAPYPKKYEKRWRMKNKQYVLLRPIKPEDENMMKELFKTFSERTILFRFFEVIRSMPHDHLVRYTQIDYDREMAIVATGKEKGRKRIFGVGRLNYYPNLESLEFSVVVGDPWQRQGLGAKLLNTCIEIARERGVNELWGEVMPENLGMLNLCRKCGFDIEKNEETGLMKAFMKL